MALLKTSKQFVELVKQAAACKTYYVTGGIGYANTAANVERACKAYAKNKKRNIPTDGKGFMFDCVGLIKAIACWDWTPEHETEYNNKYDYNDNGFYDKFGTMSSTDFSKIMPGEMVLIPGHIGVYVGNGLVAECTPKWDGGVQLTGLANIGVRGRKYRAWDKHARINFLSYEEDENKPPVTPTKPKGTYYPGTFPTLPKRGYFDKGDTGVNVQRVQQFLEWYKPGILKPYGSDGKYGPVTCKAVRDFQTYCKLKVDGSVGPATLAAMKSYHV